MRKVTKTLSTALLFLSATIVIASLISILAESGLTKKQQSVVGYIAEQKLKQIQLASGFAFLTLAVYVLTGLLSHAPLVTPGFVIIVALIAIILTYRSVISYRVKTGSYGTNELDARELIQFVLDNSDTDMFNGDGTRKIFLEEMKEDKIASFNNNHGIEPNHG